MSYISPAYAARGLVTVSHQVNFWSFSKFLQMVQANLVSAVTVHGNQLTVLTSTRPATRALVYLPPWPLPTLQGLLSAHNVVINVVHPAASASGGLSWWGWMMLAGFLTLPLMMIMMLMRHRSQMPVSDNAANPQLGRHATNTTLPINPSGGFGIVGARKAPVNAKVVPEPAQPTGWRRFFHHFRKPDSKAEVANEPVTPEVETPVTFADVGGIDEVREELVEVVDFLKNPERYELLNATMPKGVLLSGRPGTGKTLLAKAVAGEAGVPFIHASGSQFVEMYVGVGAARVRELFEKARAQAPCIVFIDEIDAIGKKRNDGPGNEERATSLNQLLTEMDGFTQTKGIVVMGATNRPQLLDDALLRPGRFDRQVMVHAPDVQGREKILHIHGAKTPFAPDVSLRDWARQTTGFVGAHLKNLINEAAIWAARQGHKEVSQEAMTFAFHKVVLGPARNVLISDEDKERTAYHEAGHTLMGLWTPGADPIGSVSIIPRGMSLGVTISMPEKDRQGYNLDEVRALIKVALGGRVAEEIRYGDNISTGASNDLAKATNLTRDLVYSWSMDPDMGPANFAAIDEAHAQKGMIGRAISELTAHKIDERTNAYLSQAMDEVRVFLRAHSRQLQLLAMALLEKETLSADEVRAVVGEPVAVATKLPTITAFTPEVTLIPAVKTRWWRRRQPATEPTRVLAK